jgi:outer membrane lipoprotein-sorting protein
MKYRSSIIHAFIGFALLSTTPFCTLAKAGEKDSPKISTESCVVELKELMATLALKKEDTARFKEQKFLKVLSKPLKSEGTLHFRAPDYLEKRTLKPKEERLVVENNIVRFFDHQKETRSLSLDAYPPLRDLLNGIRFTLLGEVAELKKYFELELRGDCRQWSLILVPKSESAMNILERIIILGEKDTIVKITLVEANGNFSIMTIEKGLS